MSLEDDLHEALFEGYRRTGQEVGYWATRFLQALRRHGGLAIAKRMLTPRTAGQRAGLDKLIAAGREDLTLEAIVLQPRFASLFTRAELETAKSRLGEFGRSVQIARANRDRVFPDELDPGPRYTEGARKQVRVNAYERAPKARSACIEHYGPSCSVCGFEFARAYGKIGESFIHVHHLHPLALTDGEYELDPIKDLRPVCPNCHAMLHRPERLLSIDELRAIVEKQKG